MCVTRSWKNIDFQGGATFVSLIATRSDNLLIRVQVPLFPEVPTYLVIDKLIKQLNSMKDCKCTDKEMCEKHKEKE